MSVFNFPSEPIRSACIIGCGAAGITTAYALLQQGIDVTIYEQASDVGGTWVYKEDRGPSPPVPFNDPNAHNPTLRTTAMYAGLHTNLPATLMGFREYKFDNASAVFPLHLEVLDFDGFKYLKKYYSMTHIQSKVKFNTLVTEVSPAANGWTVKTDSEEPGTFDAVAVCSGHFQMPYIPDIPGLRKFAESHPGCVTHSKNYRRPEYFKGKKVLVIGGGHSANDIAREIASVTSVTQSVFTELLPINPTQSKVVFRGPVQIITHNEVIFSDGASELPDHILIATGYMYSYPFLQNLSPPLTTDGRRVHNIAYQLLYAPRPTLAFVGLPFKVVPFPLFEVQAKFIAYCWRGFSTFPEGGNLRPTPAELKDQAELNEQGGKEFHCMAENQWDYQDFLAMWYKGEKSEAWRIELRKEALLLRLQHLGY